MPRKLKIEDQAYNACIAATNEIRPQLDDLLERYNRAAAGVEAMYSLGARPQLDIQEVKNAKRSSSGG